MLYRFTALAGLAFLCGFAFSAGMRYPGNGLVFLIFSVIANVLLIAGFRKKALFFDAFIGIFLWLGFWLKLAMRLYFAEGKFHEPTGAFDFSGAAYDQVLIIASVAFAALLTASFVRQRFFSYPAQCEALQSSGLYAFYERHRRAVLILFVLAVTAACAANIQLGVYQRGMAAQTVLPFGLSGIFKWLLQFGFATISALIIRFEVERSRGLPWAAFFIPLLEGFMTNVSLLSRGMILNSSALGYGALRMMKACRFRIRSASAGTAILLFAVLFAMSVLSVNWLRSSAFSGPSLKASSLASPEQPEARRLRQARAMTTPLFIDRWIGIEPLMAVSSSSELGWDVWREVWAERFQEGRLSLYDRKFIDSPYSEQRLERNGNHFVSLPGIVAFLFYPGSLPFLFATLLAFALLAAVFEIASYRLVRRNLVLASLVAQVIAFRYASFGYVPAQSYLLFGTLLANVIILFALDAFLQRRYPAVTHSKAKRI